MVQLLDTTRQDEKSTFTDDHVFPATLLVNCSGDVNVPVLVNGLQRLSLNTWSLIGTFLPMPCLTDPVSHDLEVYFNSLFGERMDYRLRTNI